jgi:hypothetical protein
MNSIIYVSIEYSSIYVHLYILFRYRVTIIGFLRKLQQIEV